MDFKKLALGLLFGGVLAAGAVACGGDGGGGGTTGAATGSTTGSITEPDVLGCTPASDGDTGTQSYSITHLGLPAADGFNLDGLNNAPSPGGAGQNVAGCGKVDIAGGIDNALSTIATSLKDVIDLGSALQETLVNDPGPDGSLEVTVTATKLNGTPNDSCIGVSVLVHSTDPAIADQTFAGRGAITDNVAFILFDSTITFTVALTVPPASCTGGVCNPASLSIAVRGARARVTLNAAQTDIVAGSILGGFIFFKDADPAYADANTTGFEAALTQYAADVGLADSFKTMAIQAFAGARDLHMNADGTLSPCTGANTSLVNKNAVSVALALDSL